MSYVLPADPTAIETAVATNADAITANSTTLTLHGTRLTATESATTTNTANIATNTAAIASNDTDIATNASNIATNTSNISTNATNISSNATNISANTTNISANTSGISAINAAKGAANGFCPLDGSAKVPAANMTSTFTSGVEVTSGGVQTSFIDLPSTALGPYARIGTGSIGGYYRMEVTTEPGDAAGQAGWYFGVPGNSSTVTGIHPASITLGSNFTENSLGNNASALNIWDYLYVNNSPVVTSDRKTKKEIKDETRGMAFLKKLKPRTWKRKIGSGMDKKHHGLVAQELMEILTSEEQEEFLSFPPNGEEGVIGIRYGEFTAPLIKAVQELEAENAAIKARLDILESK